MRPLNLLALLSLLSCSGVPLRTALPDVATAPPSAAVPHGPDARTWMEARFHRYQTGLSEPEIRDTVEAILEASAEHDVDRELVLAVIHIESAFNNFARSNVGALGLMQIMPDTGRELAEELEIPWDGEHSLFNPATNVRMGVRYLAQLRSRFGSWDRALAAYNWGPGAIHRRLQKGHEVPNLYADKVLDRYARNSQS